MPRLRVLLLHETMVQRRYRIWLAVAFVAIVWVAIVRGLPPAARPVAVPLIMVAEAVVTGLFLAAGLTLFEKDERVLAPLAVTPARGWERLAVRVGLLTLASLAVAGAVTAAAPGVAVDVVTLLLGVGLGAALLLLVGLIAATRFEAITDYLIGVQAPLTPLAAPLLPAFGIAESPLWWLVPTHPAFVLIFGAYDGLPRTTAVAAVVVSLAWIALAGRVAVRAQRRFLERTA